MCESFVNGHITFKRADFDPALSPMSHLHSWILSNQQAKSPVQVNDSQPEKKTVGYFPENIALELLRCRVSEAVDWDLNRPSLSNQQVQL